MQRIRCPGCPAILKVDEARLGTKATCPGCKHTFMLPTAKTAVAPKAESAPPKKAPVPTVTRPAPPPPKEEVVDLTVEDMAPEEIMDVIEAEPEPSERRPNRRKRKGSQSRKPAFDVDFSFFSGNRILGGVIILLGLFIFLGTVAGGMNGGAYGAGQGAGGLFGLAVIFAGVRKVAEG